MCCRAYSGLRKHYTYSETWKWQAGIMVRERTKECGSTVQRDSNLRYEARAMLEWFKIKKVSKLQWLSLDLSLAENP